MNRAGRAGAIVCLGLAPVMLLAWLTSGIQRPLILYNASPSEPPGFYRLTNDKPAQGRIIAFRVPPLGRTYAATRTRSPVTYTVLKAIAATPGDTVCDQGGVFRINGSFLGVAQARDSSGTTLPQWRECRQLRDQEYFVFSRRIPNSFDSRYFGPVSRGSILAVYAPLWTHT
jgi:conjugative transfer signal peptidase TraF